MSDFDSLLIRCPRLGMEVTFAYCRREEGNLPCARTLVCWSPRFPVDEYLKNIMSREEWERCFARTPKDKLSQLLEIADTAKRDDTQ